MMLLPSSEKVVSKSVVMVGEVNKAGGGGECLQTLKMVGINGLQGMDVFV